MEKTYTTFDEAFEDHPNTKILVRVGRLSFHVSREDLKSELKHRDIVSPAEGMVELTYDPWSGELVLDEKL